VSRNTRSWPARPEVLASHKGASAVRIMYYRRTKAGRCSATWNSRAVPPLPSSAPPPRAANRPDPRALPLQLALAPSLPRSLAPSLPRSRSRSLLATRSNAPRTAHFHVPARLAASFGFIFLIYFLFIEGYAIGRDWKTSSPTHTGYTRSRYTSQHRLLEFSEACCCAREIFLALLQLFSIFRIEVAIGAFPCTRANCSC
jgi:hypothetical protein